MGAGGGAGGGNAQSANQTSANRSFGVGSFGGPIGGYSASGWGPTMSTGVGGHFWNGTNPGFAHASGISKNGGIIRSSSASGKVMGKVSKATPAQARQMLANQPNMRADVKADLMKIAGITSLGTVSGASGIMNAPAIGTIGLPSLNPTASPFGGRPGSISPPTSGKGLPSASSRVSGGLGGMAGNPAGFGFRGSFGGRTGTGTGAIGGGGMTGTGSARGGGAIGGVQGRRF